MSAKKQVTTKSQQAKARVAKKNAIEQKVSIDAMFEGIVDVVAQPVGNPEPEFIKASYEEDDYNEFAPPNLPSGWLKEHADADMEPEAIIMPPDQPAPEPPPVEKPSLPSPRPVEAVTAPAVALSPKAPTKELVGDAVIIQRLINGINYLYPMARLTKGPRGPQPDSIARIQTNIVAAKELITRLS